MKHVPLREFCQGPTQYLSQLPIILTQYKKPIAILRKYTQGAEVLETLKTEVRVVKSGGEPAEEVASGLKTLANIIPVVPNPKPSVKEEKMTRENILKKTPNPMFEICKKHKVYLMTCGCSPS